MNSWYFILLGSIFYPFLKLLAKAINRQVIQYRQKKFLKLVDILFPANEKITFISIEGSDKRAMKKLEQELREQYEVFEVE